MTNHVIELRIDELVFAVGALIECHRNYEQNHREALEEYGYSPYPMALNALASAYETMNAALKVPRQEVLSRCPS
jgi:hypothetical protein